MNYYPHHIGDFNNATRHLTRVERSLYRDLLELYYDTEQPLPATDTKALCKRVLAHTEEEQEAVTTVLLEFFILDGDVWKNQRCDKEIANFRAKQRAATKAGKASAQRRTSVQRPLSKRSTNVQLTRTRTNNQNQYSVSYETEATPITEPSPKVDTEVRPKSEPHSLVAYFVQVHTAKFGLKPMVVEGKDHRLAKSILGQFPLDSAKELVDVFFARAEGDEFVGEAGCSFGVFYSKINSLLTGGKGGENRGNSKNNSGKDSKSEDGFEGIRALAADLGVNATDFFQGFGSPKNSLPEAGNPKGESGDHAPNSRGLNRGTADQGNQSILLSPRRDLPRDEHRCENPKVRDGPSSTGDGH